MPFVHIHWFEGRTPEQKEEIARRITDALVEVGNTTEEHVMIKFDDSPKHDWMFQGVQQHKA